MTYHGSRFVRQSLASSHPAERLTRRSPIGDKVEEGETVTILSLLEVRSRMRHP